MSFSLPSIRQDSYILLVTHLLRLVLIRHVKMESHLSDKKIFLSQLTAQHLKDNILKLNYHAKVQFPEVF